MRQAAGRKIWSVPLGFSTRATSHNTGSTGCMMCSAMCESTTSHDASGSGICPASASTNATAVAPNRAAGRIAAGDLRRSPPLRRSAVAEAQPLSRAPHNWSCHSQGRIARRNQTVDQQSGDASLSGTRSWCPSRGPFNERGLMCRPMLRRVRGVRFALASASEVCHLRLGWFFLGAPS
jgi:hypothetical protein